MNHTDLCVFAQGTSRSFGERICAHLGVPLSDTEERDFPDGEHKTRPLAAVRDRDVYVVASLYSDEWHSVNDKLCRLLFFLGAVRDASARRVTAVVPYLCYARKDQRSKPRDPVTTRYVARCIESVGTDRLLTMDVHNLPAFENAYRIPTENLPARSLFVEHFKERFADRPLVVVSPDIGGVKRAEAFRQELEQAVRQPVPLAFVEKYRSAGKLTGGTMVGDVAGRVALILDDLISSGGTIIRAAAACRAARASGVQAAATHGVFTREAEQLFADSAIDSIVVTDTVGVGRRSAGGGIDRLLVLPTTRLFAQAIRQLHTAERVGALLENADLEGEVPADHQPATQNAMADYGNSPQTFGALPSPTTLPSSNGTAARA